MQVFKCAMRIVRQNLIYLLIYVVGLSFMGVAMTASLGIGNIEGFERADLDYAVVDRDGSEVSEAIADFMAVYGNPIEVADEKSELQDAVAKGEVEYVLVIPDGYGAAFERATGSSEELPRMEATYSYLASTGIMLDANLDNYAGMLSTYMAMGMDVDEASEHALDAMADQASVSMLEAQEEGPSPETFSFYLQFSMYGLFASVIACLGIVISTMRKDDVRRRQMCAPVSSVGSNAQIALASLIVVVFAAAYVFLLGLAVFWDSAMSAGPEALALMALSLLVFSLVPLGVAFMAGMLGVSAAMANAIGNIMGLVVSFMGGAWIPLEMVGEPVRIAAMFLPGLWYTSSLDTAAAGIGEPGALASYGGDLLVLGLYAVLFLLLGLLLGRLRMRTRKS